MADELYVGPLDDPDRYTLGMPVGAGAEGVLYKAHVLVGGNVPLQVAVKMLHPNHRLRIGEWAVRWRDQVELLRSLQVPGVVTVREGFIGSLPHRQAEADPETTTLYLVMNWVEGASLDGWLAENSATSADDRLKRLLPVAAALDIMHSGHATAGTPVIHGDIKPSNILVRDTGETVLVDFGLVRLLPGGERTTGVSGTPGYVAPEVTREGRYTPAADRYSLGAVAYFLLTSEEPPDNGSVSAMELRLDRVESGNDQLAKQITAMLDPEPSRRPAILANWCAQMRGSSIDAQLQPDVLRPVASGRFPDAAAEDGASIDSGGVPWWRRKRALLVGFVALAAVSASLSIVLTSGASARHPKQSLTKERHYEAPTTTTTSLPATTTSTAPAVKTSPATFGGGTAAGTPCYNDYLGYQVTVPPSLTASPATSLTGDCEEFQFNANQTLPNSSGVLTQSIVFAKLAAPITTYLSAAQSGAKTRTVQIAGYTATVITYVASYPEEGPFTAGSLIYTYLVNVGPVVLSAQLALPPSQISQQATDMSVLDTMMGSLEFRSSTVCVNSFDQRCGPFHWNPQPPAVLPMTASATLSPQPFVAGQPVTFNVQVSDPQDDQIVQNYTSYGDDNEPMTAPSTITAFPGLVGWVRVRTAPAKPTPEGEWSPPQPLQGTQNYTYTHTYAAAGSYTVTLGFSGSDSASGQGADPYLNIETCTIQVTVSPSGTASNATTSAPVNLTCTPPP